MQITLYKGIPFSPENKNVLYFKSALERNLYLQTFDFRTEGISQFSLFGSEENPILDIDISKDEFGNPPTAFDFNYLQVNEFISPENKIRSVFYFIDKYEITTSQICRLYLTKDIFQSDFNRRLEFDGTESGILRPKLLNSNIIAGHKFNENEPHEVDDSIVTSYSEIEPERVFGSKTYYIAIHCSLQKYGESILLARTPFAFDDTTTHNIQEKLLSISTNETFRIDRTNEQGVLENEFLTYEVLNAYVIPSELIDMNLLDTQNYQEGVFYKTSGSFPSYYCMNIGKALAGVPENRAIVNPFITTYSGKIKANEFEKTSFGTLSNQIEIPNDNHEYDYSLKLILSNDIGFTLEAIGEIKDLTNDFEVNFTKNQASSYLAQNKSSIALKRIGNVMNTAFSIGGLVKGQGGSINAITQSVMGIIDTESQIADMKRKPPTLTSDANSITNMQLYFGIAKFVAVPTNLNQLKTHTQYYGYLFNNFISELDFNSFETIPDDVNFIYFKTGMTNIQGNFNTNTKLYFENLFKNGIRIWFNKDKFLQTFNQKELGE